ncbi:MAG TPA: adenylate/guanylate cyclase domain-containing protein [Acidimicrobiia bacterium]|nr:adenylate/guanylate cyclase domain-containing protein [Acidimicrobiia bacterium]
MGLGRLPRSIAELAEIVALPDDSQDERLRKATFLLSVGVTIILGLVWAAAFGFLGYRLPASVPLAYSILASLSLAFFIRTKRYPLFRSIHLSLMLILPFLFQLSMGGFVASGAMVMWSFMAPIGALVLAGTRHGVPWFVGFVALVGLSGFLDQSIPGVEVSQGRVIAFFVFNISALSALVYLLLQYFMRGLERTRAALELEQEKSERLLLNVLPEPIARRLMDGEEPIADAFSEVTVLFADIVDFTQMSDRLAPEQTVQMLNEVFSVFDQLVERWGLEKIKTIGDAYMAVAGVPVSRPDHAEAVAEMALAMREVAVARHLEVRIGIDSGPVVAGVIGRRKFSYDLWGDTVNTASRMESHGLPGEIQVTPRLYRRLSEKYRFRPRGPVAVKGKGEMEPYLLMGRAADVMAQPTRGRSVGSD